MALSEAARVKMLEELASDKELKATQRLRALEELGRIEARKHGAAAAAPDSQAEVFADPMADLDEMEAARQKRAARGSRRKAATG